MCVGYFHSTNKNNVIYRIFLQPYRRKGIRELKNNIFIYCLIVSNRQLTQKKLNMFGFEDLMKNVDLGDILEKVGLSDKDKKEVTTQAANALKYRTTKETAIGNEGTMKNLLSASENNEEANKVAKKLESDLAYNLKNKSGMSDGIIDQIKSGVMEKVMGSFAGAAGQSGDKEGNSLISMLTDVDLLSKFKDGGIMDTMKSKLGGFFK